MKLLACHIDNFGKLSNFDMKFLDGINVIAEDNGWGKSTLAAFLKAMLFGLDPHREAETDETERRGYMPWQGGRYGGELDIEVKGKHYRIRRWFGNSEREDVFWLYDLDSRKESHDYSENIGTQIFDLDRNSFRKTIFVGQNDCQTGTSDSIAAKLGDLAEVSDEIANFEEANSWILERLKSLSPESATGSLVRRKNMIRLLNSEKKSLETAEEEADEIRSRMDEKKNQYQQLIYYRGEYSRALVKASADSRRRELQSSYQQLKADLSEHQADMERYKTFFRDGLPTEDVFDDCAAGIQRLSEKKVETDHLRLTEGEQQTLNKMENQFAAGLPKDEEISGQLMHAISLSRERKSLDQMERRITLQKHQAELEQSGLFVDPNPEKSILVPIGAGGLGLGILGLAAGLFYMLYAGGSPFWLIPGIILLAAGIGLAAAGIHANHSMAEETAHELEARDRRQAASERPIRKMQKEYDEKDSLLKQEEKELAEYLAMYPFLDNSMTWQEQIYALRAYKKQMEELQEKERKYQEARAEQEKAENDLKKSALALGLDYGPSLAADLNALRAKAAEYRLMAAEWEKLTGRIQKFEREQNLRDVFEEEDCPYSLDELYDQIHMADAQIEQLRGEIEQYARHLEDLQQQLDQGAEKDRELNLQKKQFEEEAKEYELLQLTRHYMTKAKTQFTSRYMGPLTSAFSKYYEILTGEQSDAWMIDSDLSLRLREKGKMRETKWLSAGYRDLLGVCMRMAMVDAMYPEEKPFLIFDDPFVNLDDKKLDNGKRLLLAMEDEYQVIYFTCHGSRILNS